MEVSRPPFFNTLTTSGLRRQFAAWARDIGLSLYGFDCWVDVNPYEAPRETLAAFHSAIDFAADLDLGILITHDPWAAINRGRSPSVCLRANVRFFREVADLAAAANLAVIFEPHPDTLSMNNDWAIEWIDGIERPNVGLLFDCCHYGVGQPDSYLRAVSTLGHRIRHLHWSDGDCETYALHLPLGDGTIDLDGLRRELVEIEFRGSITNDLFNYPMLESGARQNAPLMQALEQTFKIGTP